MSTILDALKKVEQERETDTSAAHQRQLEALQPAADKHQKGRIRNRIIGGLLVIVFAIFGGITFYLFRGDSPSDAPQTADTDKSQPTPAITSQKTNKTARENSTKLWSDKARRRPAARPAESQPTRPATPQTPLNRSAQAPTVDRKPVETAVVPKTAFSRKPTSDTVSVTVPPEAAPAPQARSTARPPASGPPKTASVSQLPRNAPTTPSHSHIERLTDGSLNVQAIAWSPIAEERMAVVNSKIVREGNSVDEYTLVTIGQDDVVVRKGRRRWRVVIGRP